MGTNRSAATTSDTDTTSTDARALTAHSLSRTFRQRATNWLPIESLRAESTRTAATESNRQLVTTQDPASPPPLHQTDETTGSRLIIADHPTSSIQVHDPETIILCPTFSLDGTVRYHAEYAGAAASEPTMPLTHDGCLLNDDETDPNESSRTTDREQQH